MKLFISSDWHGDASTSGVDRFDEIRGAAFDVANAAIAEKRKGNDVAFVFGGDLTDPDTTRSFRAIGLAIDIAMMLSRNGVQSFWIAGNHDTIENDRGSTTLEPLAMLAKNEHKPPHFAHISVAETPATYMPCLGLRLVCLPHVARARNYEPARFVESIDELPVDFPYRERFLVIGHLTVPSAERGSESDDFARGRDMIFPVAECRRRWGDRCILVNGHYHRKQITKDGVHIPGSLARLRHDEEHHEPGYLVIEV
jgi:DNA repair exonuclease SbcCD nuclease subunit